MIWKSQKAEVRYIIYAQIKGLSIILEQNREDEIEKIFQTEM